MRNASENGFRKHHQARRDGGEASTPSMLKNKPRASRAKDAEHGSREGRSSSKSPSRSGNYRGFKGKREPSQKEKSMALHLGLSSYNLEASQKSSLGNSKSPIRSMKSGKSLKTRSAKKMQRAQTHNQPRGKRGAGGRRSNSGASDLRSSNDSAKHGSKNDRRSGQFYSPRTASDFPKWVQGKGKQTKPSEEPNYMSQQMNRTQNPYENHLDYEHDRNKSGTSAAERRRRAQEHYEKNRPKIQSSQQQSMSAVDVEESRAS